MILAPFWEAFGGQCYKLSDKKALYVSLMKFGVVFKSILGPLPPTGIHEYPRVSPNHWVWDPRGGVRGGVLCISTRCSEDSEIRRIEKTNYEEDLRRNTGKVYEERARISKDVGDWRGEV